MPERFCVHRWSVVKRWSDKQDFHAIQKCRRCQQWKRTDISMNAERGKLELSNAWPAGLENNSSTNENPETSRPIDPDTGEITSTPKDSL